MQWLCVNFAPTNPENLKWEFILFNHTTIMSQNFGKFANFAPDITQPIWSSKIIFVFFNPEFVGCVVKTLIQNQISICINTCDLNIWTLLRYEKISKSMTNIFTTYWDLDFVEIFHNIEIFIPDQNSKSYNSEKTGKKILLLHRVWIEKIQGTL